MWESVFSKEQLEIQMNAATKSFRVCIRPDAAEHPSAQMPVLQQTELFELMHTFLAMNRRFNDERMYYDDAGQR